MTKKLDEYSKEELIDVIKSLKKRKKFGLVWEDTKEDVVAQCQEMLPVLEEIADRSIKNNPNEPTNLIIEGDNYHALSVLNYTHAGKIDAIYADPPYNTGAKNWVYNNHFVDSNDTFRHSKWLGFMEKRLLLAKSLLKYDGIIVVTIDDYEVANLTLLMNEIFGEENHLGTIVIKNNPQGRSSVSGFQISHEYALFYSRSTLSKIGRLPRTQGQIDRYKETDELGVFEWRNFRAQYSTQSPKMAYPIFIQKDCSSFRVPQISWNKVTQLYDLLEEPGSSEILSLPIDPSGRIRTWKWSIETVDTVKETEMGVRLDKDKKPSVYYKGRMADEYMLPYTIWDKPEYSASSMGTNLLTSILGSKKFDYPKSLYAVMDNLRVLSADKHATFLDFFAGSGTTGHAVMELNKADGGHRQFIICTNNENKIAEEVTYPRIKNVVNGYDGVEGIPSNVRYFKTDFVNKEKTDDQTRLSLVERCSDMIRIREDTYNLLIDEKEFKLYSGIDHNAAIIFNPHDIEDCIRKIEATDINKPLNIYIFSYSNYAYEEDVPETKLQYTIRPIPESILEVYKRIFKENNNV